VKQPLTPPLSGLATSLTKAGTGTLVLSGGGSYTGELRIADGLVRLGASNALPTSSGLSIAADAPISATLDLNGFNQTLSRLVFTDTDSAGALTVTGGTSSTLTINADASTQLGPGGVISGTRNVTTDMSGLGALVWSGAAHTFRVGARSGATQSGTFNAGTFTTLLADNNSITTTSLRVGDMQLNNSGGTSRAPPWPDQCPQR
jgi:fibronectin-binding autotransporter adhesin